MTRTRAFIQHTLPYWLLSVLLFSPTVMIVKAEPLAGTSPQRLGNSMAADQLMTFAEQLMQQGEYFRAITEYRRFLFTYPDDPRRVLAHFRIGLALYRGESYQAALETFQEVAQRYPTTPYGRQAQLWQGESLMRQAQYTTAGQVYADIIAQSPSDDLGQLARYQRAWTLVYQRQWQAAARQFRQVATSSPLYHAAQQVANDVLEGQQLVHKSPLLAGLLSGLLPGSGQLYNGRLGDALLAFLLNGLFVAGAVEAIQQQQPAIAGVLSFFEAGWYVGNVYSAVNGAHKHNRYATETFLRNLENRFRVQAPEASRPQTLGIRLFSVNF